MTDLSRKLALPCIALAWFLIPTQGHAACTTSLASLNGWYSVLISGATVGATPAPKYAAGALLFNGSGGITGSNVYSGAGVGSVASGSYALNSDCTLTLSLTIGGSAVQAYTVAMKQQNQAVGIETDASAVATIDLQAQYPTVTTALNFTSASLNGTYAASCDGPGSQQSDLNVATFTNGALKGTDPYNNGGGFAVSGVPYSGTYTVNTDGTFKGSLTVNGTPFNFYGVIAGAGTKIEYIYSAVTNGVPTAAFASCVGKLAAAVAF